MHSFQVVFRSFADVWNFVFLASARPFAITVGNSGHMVNAKSMMIMFSLDYRQSLTVTMDCTEAEFLEFREAARRYLV